MSIEYFISCFAEFHPVAAKCKHVISQIIFFLSSFVKIHPTEKFSGTPFLLLVSVLFHKNLFHLAHLPVLHLFLCSLFFGPPPPTFNILYIFSFRPLSPMRFSIFPKMLLYLALYQDVVLVSNDLKKCDKVYTMNAFILGISCNVVVGMIALSKLR